jgi:hypothetical protein
LIPLPLTAPREIRALRIHAAWCDKLTTYPLPRGRASIDAGHAFLMAHEIIRAGKRVARFSALGISAMSIGAPNC